MVIWETVLLLSATLLFYRLLITHIRDREKSREFLEILLLSFTHKLGNLISSQVVNLNLLREQNSQSALDRLLDTYDTMSKDMEDLARIIEGFKYGAVMEEEKVDIRMLLDNSLTDINRSREKRQIIVKITDRKCEIKCIGKELEIAIRLIIDNAIRYSDSWIKIRLLKVNSSIVLIVVNDKKLNASKGTGMGLKIVEKLCKRYRAKFQVRDREGTFTTAIIVNTDLINRFISLL